MKTPYEAGHGGRQFRTNGVRLGIAGCGGISVAHAEAAELSAGAARFVACCDVDRERAEQWAERYGVERAYTDLEAMLAAEELDGVLLATWPNLHREQLELCLRHGARHILCEKSLAVTATEAAEIHALVSAAGATVMEGFMYRHHPAIRELERSIAAGEIGEVDYVRATFNTYDPESEDPADATRNWRRRLECAGGVPFDLVCYTVNACGHFTGGVPVRAYATGSHGVYGTINRMFGSIAYDNGRTGVFESSKKAAFGQELEIVGSAGALRYPIAWTTPADTPVIREARSWNRIDAEARAVPAGVGAPRGVDAFTLQLRNFADVIRGTAAPLVPLIQSVVNVHVMDALLASVREQRAVEVALPAAIERSYRSHLQARAARAETTAVSPMITPGPGRGGELDKPPGTV